MFSFLGTNYLAYLNLLEYARTFFKVNIYHVPAFNTVPNMLAVNYTSTFDGVEKTECIEHNFYLQAEGIKKSVNKAINIFLGSHGF